MTKRIFRSILCVSAAVLMASLIITLGVLYGYVNAQQRNELQDEAVYLAPGVESQGAEYLKRLEATDKRITLVDRDGTVVYDSQVDAAGMENHAGREEVKEAFETGEGEASRKSSSIAEPTIYYARLLGNGQVLRLAGSEHHMVTVLVNMIYPICAVCLLMILLAAFFAMRSSAKIVEPINCLNLEEVKEGDVYEELAPLIQKIGHQKETIVRQVMEAQQQQREFEDMKEQMRREFTANVSHELKTPLTSISGFAEIIQNGIAKPEDIPGFAGKIFEESQRLIVLVNDIIKVSQLDEGGIPYDKEELDLFQMSEEVLERLREPAKKKNLNLQLLGDHVRVRGVRLILDEVIYNLCDNAVKYNRENGTVIVRVKQDRRGAQLVVADTGIGISREHQERVFERFYRVDKSHSKSIGGTGLGLSIVKHGASFLGVSVELDSRPDEGTVVTLTWKT